MEGTPPDTLLRQQGLGTLSVLHDHLISYITYLLDLEDVVRLSRCSRILRVFANEEPLWLALSLKLHEGLVVYKANWRQTALAAYTARPVPSEVVDAAARPLPPLPGLQSVFLYRRWYRCHVDLRAFIPPSGAPGVDVVHAAAMTPADFVGRFDRPGMPALLTGLQDAWPAAAWSLPALCASFPTARFKVSKPHGGRALMTLPAYVDYMARQSDEEPLYVFDASFVEAAPGMRKLYEVPHVFAQDYFSVLGGGRPAYRWLVLGPARAGASWHVDPSLTSAWNALLSGRKRWALYPPHMPPPGVPLEDDGEECAPAEDALSSLQWFLEVYPSLPPERRPIELVQEPGQVVFIPGGWWHCVLNLDTAVAVTQNYVGAANLPRVARYMAEGSAAYMRAPLAYYDAATEVEPWAARFPHLPWGQEEAEGSEEEGDAGGVKEEGRAGGREEEAGRKAECFARGLGARALQGRSTSSAHARCGGGGGGASAAAADQIIVAANGGGSNITDTAGSPDGVDPEPELDLRWRELAVWRRERALGRWLRGLWEAEPTTRPAIEDCVFRYLHGAAWRDVLRAIAAQQVQLCGGGIAANGAVATSGSNGRNSGGAAGVEHAAACAGPSAFELMPLVGADALVFLHGSMAIKIFTHEVPATRSLMCALESCVPHMLLGPGGHTRSADCGGPVAGSAESLAPLLPLPRSCGAVAVRFRPRQLEGEEEAARDASEQRLLYVVQDRLQASSVLQDRLPQLLAGSPSARAQLADIAEALGHAVGALHAAAAELTKQGQQQHARDDLTDGGASVAEHAAVGSTAAEARGQVRSVEEWEALVRSRAVWHDREGFIWVSGLGCVSKPPDADEGDSNANSAMVDAGTGTSPGAACATAPAAPGSDAAAAAASLQLSLPVHSPWWPFAAYLRRRRQRLLGEELAHAELPGWVRQQLPAYLPPDPATLLGLGPLTAAGAPPLLLHGDVTAANVVLDPALSPPPAAASSGRPGLRLVDFADSGHGDPLFELVPVMASCLGCDRMAMERFWAAYRSHVDTDRVWPQRRQGGAAATGDGTALSYVAMCYCLMHEEAEVMLRRLWGAEARAAVAGGGDGHQTLANGIGGPNEDTAEGQPGQERTLVKLATSLWGFLDTP